MNLLPYINIVKYLNIDNNLAVAQPLNEIVPLQTDYEDVLKLYAVQRPNADYRCTLHKSVNDKEKVLYDEPKQYIQRRLVF